MPERSPAGLSLCGWFGPGEADGDQRGQRDEVGRHVDQEDGPQASADEQRPRHGRRRELADRLADLCQPSGAAEMFLGHQQRRGGRIGGPLERAEPRVEERGDVDVPHLELAGQEHHGGEHGAQSRAGIAEDHHQAAVPAVGEHARDGQYGEVGQRPDHQVDREERRRAGGLVHPHAERETGEARSQRRHELPEPDRDKGFHPA